MRSQFIPHKQALELKELGFDKDCLAYYNIDPIFKEPFLNIINKPFSHEWCLPAPLFQQAFDWFEEKHSIQVFTDYTFYDGFYYYYNIVLPNGQTIFVGDIDNTPDGFIDKKEARIACLDKLIEIVKFNLV